MENNIEERSDYGSIEEVDKHRQLFGYPELYQAVQKFDVSYPKATGETIYGFGNVPYSSDVDIALESLAKFVHSRLSSEEVAILSFLLFIIDEEYRFSGYSFIYPLLDGVKKLVQKSVEEKDIVNACVYFIEYLDECIMG